ncbi:MAG: response regulator [Caldithrix sp.]|nr:response regulator [Caldithrix sp.]
MKTSDSILIIEDDWKIINLIEIHLKDLGFRVEKASDGRTGLDMAVGKNYALIILDLMLPEIDGLEICRRIREKDYHIPILMLTAKNEELDKILGLEIGADDYITKPFSVRELIARVKAIIRRIEADKEKVEKNGKKETLSMGELYIDAEKHKVTLSGKTIELTAKEFDLLYLFASHPGRIYNRETLLDIVWGYQYDGYFHTVNSHINRLRNKIEEDPSNPKYIKTLWGVGYKFCETEEELS